MMSTVVPHKHDILLGRGASINAHSGNQHFRSLVDRYKQEFETARRKEKRTLATRIVTEINQLDPPGRFLMEASGGNNSSSININEGKEDDNDGGDNGGINPAILAKSWVCVPLEKAIVKTLHRLREKGGGGSVGVTASPEDGDGKDDSSSKIADEDGNLHLEKPVVSEGKNEVKDTSTSPPKVQKAKKPKNKIPNNKPRKQNSAASAQKGQMNEPSRPEGEKPLHSNNGVLAHYDHSQLIASKPETPNVFHQDSGPDDDFGVMLNKITAIGDDHDNMSGDNELQNDVPEGSLACGAILSDDIADENDRVDQFESMIDMVLNNEKTFEHVIQDNVNGQDIFNPNQDVMEQEDVKTHEDDDEWDTFLQNHVLHTQHNSNAPSIPQTQQYQGSAQNDTCFSTKEDANSSPQGQLALENDVESFLKDFSLMHDGESSNNIFLSQEQKQGPLQQQLLHGQSQTEQIWGQVPQGQQVQVPQEVTLQQWIDNNIPQKNDLYLRAPMILGYLRKALVVGKKLVEFLIESEETTKASVSQSSIAVDNILIRLKKQTPSDNVDEPKIDHIVVMNIGESSSPGTTMSLLAALGAVFYELFSGEEPAFKQEGVPPAMSSMGLDNDNYHERGAGNSNSTNIDGPRRRKKKQPHTRHGLSNECIPRLESLGLPHSICMLVQNLLDANLGDLSPDNTYSSFGDVNTDMGPMIKDPNRFLDNIQINPVPQLVICNGKLYGRQKEVRQLEQSFRLYMEQKGCAGVMITGEAGVGKSKLGMHLGNLSASYRGTGGYFLQSKFDQNKDVYPLATISTLFNTLCDLFVRDTTPEELAMVDGALESSLGSHSAYLASVLPSLGKIMPSCTGLSPPGNWNCIDSVMSVQYLFTQLLNVISLHCNGRPIILLLDDIQWADPASLMLLRGLISNNYMGNKSTFLACCYRNDEVVDNEPFQNWLASVEGCSMEVIKVENIDVDGVNELVSDTLHLTPRTTRPLASILHHKTRGNPLFLRRLMDGLNGQGLIYVDLSGPRWTWDLNRIMDLKISDDVVALLIKDMQRLPEELQVGLRVASCIGSCLQDPIIDILSTDLNQNFRETFTRLTQGGYMDNIQDGKKFCFSHDKVQQAAYQMMSEQKRKENHMRFGLAICANSMAGGEEKDGLFFTAVNQMNKGGPEVLPDLSQRTTIAMLNLKAGRHAILFSDFHNALKLFKHGIQFLDQANHWEKHYTLSLDLYDAISEVACITNDRASVQLYTEELVAHATNFDDKLNCLYAATKSLRHAELQQEAMDSTLQLLCQLGEPTLGPLDELTNEMDVVDGLLQNVTDDAIYSMARCNEKRFVVCQKLYANLLHILHFLKPSLIGAASLRMIEITLRKGLCPISPLAFSYYGETLASLVKLGTAQRLAGIALKLIEQKDCSRYKASVIVTVYQLILWWSEPFQSVVDAHILGYKAGMQSGDILYGKMNEYFSISTSYIAGNKLSSIREKCQGFVLEMVSSQRGFSLAQPSLLHMHAIALAEGLDVLASEQIDGVPGLKEILGISMKRKDTTALAFHKTLSLTRAFLFRQLNETSNEVNMSDAVFAKKIPIRPIVLTTVFIEALIFFQFARHSKDAAKWIAKGDFLLEKIQSWDAQGRWNFRNKRLLLEAEKMYLTGQFDQAQSLYIESIQSAKAQCFIHEQAIASELAGMFYYERGFQSKARLLLKHSVECFKQWGAMAVARRIEANIQQLFAQDLQKGQLMDGEELASLFDQKESNTKKRQGV